MITLLSHHLAARALLTPITSPTFPANPTRQLNPSLQKLMRGHRRPDGAFIWALMTSGRKYQKLKSAGGLKVIFFL